jgi:myo-inositol-1(or 4)-monophosphatase
MEDIKVYLRFINNFLKDTDKILIKNFSTNLKVNYKIDESPVTKIDKLIEKKFRTKLKKDFPDHSVLGEEFKNKNNN